MRSSKKKSKTKGVDTVEADTVRATQGAEMNDRLYSRGNSKKARGEDRPGNDSMV